MYSGSHGAFSAAITVAAYQAGGGEAAAVAALPAFLSHHVLDWLGEAGFKTNRQAVAWEIAPFAVFAIWALWSGIWWVFALGWVAGNLMDIIDKRAYLKWWPGWARALGEDFCRRLGIAPYPDGGGVFHRHNPVRVPLTLGQTKFAAIVSMIIPVALAAWVVLQ